MMPSILVIKFNLEKKFLRSLQKKKNACNIEISYKKFHTSEDASVLMDNLHHR